MTLWIALIFVLLCPEGFYSFQPSLCRELVRGTNLFANPDEVNGESSDPSTSAVPGGIESLSEKNMRRPSKADLYTTGDLQALLNLHNSIQTQIGNPVIGLNTVDENPVPSGLHESVLKAVADIEQFQDDVHDVQRSVEAKVIKIRAIASDVDGTLLCSDHSIHPTTEQAIMEALKTASSPVQSLKYFFPATGKSRAGALASLGPKLGNLLKEVPGVFIQGLYVVGTNGQVIFEQKISKEEVSAAQSLANEFGLSLFGYDGDSMYCSSQSCSQEHREKFHSKFGEPLAVPLEDLCAHLPSFHKCLFMHDDEKFLRRVVRPRLEEIAGLHGAEVTQAVPYMLEWLPSGGSKANGVMELCKHLGINMEEELLALGDAENDIEMLRRSAIGVSMGNAAPSVAEAADVCLKATNDMGGAGEAIMEYGLGNLGR